MGKLLHPNSEKGIYIIYMYAILYMLIINTFLMSHARGISVIETQKEVEHVIIVHHYVAYYVLSLYVIKMNIFLITYVGRT